MKLNIDLKTSLKLFAGIAVISLITILVSIYYNSFNSYHSGADGGFAFYFIQLFGQLKFQEIYGFNGIMSLNIGSSFKISVQQIVSILFIVLALLNVQKLLLTGFHHSKTYIKFGIVIISFNAILKFIAALMELSQFLFRKELNYPKIYLIYFIMSLLVFTLLLMFMHYFNKQLTATNKVSSINNIDTEGSSIFDDRTDINAQHKKVKTHIRFFNYLVDILVIFFMYASVNYYSRVLYELTDNQYAARIFVIIFFIFYYTFLEKNLGYTAGKALTGTKVLNINGGQISLSQALGRSFSRLVPLEQITAFNNGELSNMWHDEWSNTMVVED